MYRVDLTPRARRELDAASSSVFDRIDDAILSLRDEPRPLGVLKLRGPVHRIRVGRWRVIYAVFDRDQLVIVGKIAMRSEDTYDSVEALF